MTSEPMHLELTAEETDAIMRMSLSKDMSPRTVVRQALRLYQDVDNKLSAGETCVWSGDKNRAQEFAGNLVDSPDLLAAAMSEMQGVLNSYDWVGTGSHDAQGEAEAHAAWDIICKKIGWRDVEDGTTPTKLRPANCREHLRATGQAYPKSGCSACDSSIRTGMRCPHE